MLGLLRPVVGGNLTERRIGFYTLCQVRQVDLFALNSHEPLQHSGLPREQAQRYAICSLPARGLILCYTLIAPVPKITRGAKALSRPCNILLFGFEAWRTRYRPPDVVVAASAVEEEVF